MTAPDLPRLTLDRRSTLADLVRASITDSVRSLLDNDAVVRIGHDPEGVHQARVATRRLRSDLRTFRPILDRTWSEPLRTELAWLGALLGHVRDADVLLGRITAKADGLSANRQIPFQTLVDRMEGTRARDRAVLLEAMRSPRYASLLDRLVEAAGSPRLRDGYEVLRAKRSAPRLARGPWKRLRATVHRLPDEPSNPELHEVRIRAKHARYAFEAIAPVVGGHAKRTAHRLAELQDLLGEQHDAIVAIAWLHDAATDTPEPEVAFIAGEIAGSFVTDARALLGSWRTAWKRVKHSV